MHRMTSITLLTVCLEIKVKREPLPFPPVWCNLLLLFMQSSMCSCRQVSYLLIERMNSVIYKYVLQSIRLGSPEAKASWQHLQHIAEKLWLNKKPPISAEQSDKWWFQFVHRKWAQSKLKRCKSIHYSSPVSLGNTFMLDISANVSFV